MASDRFERAGNTASNAADQVKKFADDALDTMGEKAKSAQESVNRYSRTAKDKLHEAADYVSDHGAEDLGRAATAHPVTSLLVLSAVLIGGGLLVAAMLRDDGPDDVSGPSPRPMRLASAVSGLGSRGSETLTRIRDAAFSFAFDKAVDRIDEMFPGFREHYERG